MAKTVIDAEWKKGYVDLYKTLSKEELKELDTSLSIDIKNFKKEVKHWSAELEKREAMLDCVKRAQKYLERKEQNGEDVEV